MGKRISVHLTTKELEKLQNLCDEYEECPSRIVKLAITELENRSK